MKAIVSGRPADLVRDEIQALKAYHVPSAEGMVKLDAMENPYRLPAELAARMGERLARVAVNRYPDPAALELKARLREAMAIPPGLDIVLGNGSDELIQVISLALARPGAVALAPEPSFVMYRMSATAAGMRYAGFPSAATSPSTSARSSKASRPTARRSPGSPIPTIPPATSSHAMRSSAWWPRPRDWWWSTKRISPSREGLR
jgi:histidinol-phosphate/aromatic aminotransferase/cobyric acid decarboxylase-like protein